MWIPITIAAATFQILRTSQQHRLRDLLSPIGAGFVRYLYGAPLAIVLALGVFVVAGYEVPDIPARFWPIVAAAGTAQILGTVALLHGFRARDFAIGTVYAKTEVVQVAVFAAVIAGEPLAVLGWLGVAVCLLGVAWLASGGELTSLLRPGGTGRPAEPRRVTRLGARRHAPERCEGAHARAGRDAPGLRDRVADGRTPPA
jgi:drug/metabolite transporter (DMT)-like permease